MKREKEETKNGKSTPKRKPEIERVRVSHSERAAFSVDTTS
jgi:hypothetical protein